MNAVVLDGSRDETGRSVLATLSDALAGAGFEGEVTRLREMAIAPCLGCFGCWTKTPGECVIDDDGRQVAKAVARCDLLVYVTPVTFGGVSSELKKALDRLIPNISPFFARVHGETHHQKRYPRSPSLAALGPVSRPHREAEAVFKTLIERNAINMGCPRTAAAVVSPETADLEAVVRRLVEAVAR
jgi:multimeric flavodoxin WrbA